MGAESKIEWCDATINFWWGCTKVSPGCANCYAEGISKRFGDDIWGKGKPRKKIASASAEAYKLNRKAAKSGIRLRVFGSSMGDWLDPEVPVDWLAEMLETIRQTPHLDWLLLTKRISYEWMRFYALAHYLSVVDETDDLLRWVRDWVNGAPPENVWVGVSVENQESADSRIPWLLRLPAAVRFLSSEPLLAEVNVGLDNDNYAPWSDRAKIDWIIVGGESGPCARACKVWWIRDLIKQAKCADVPVFVKQLGARPLISDSEKGAVYPWSLKDKKGGDWNEWDQDLRIREFPKNV